MPAASVRSLVLVVLVAVLVVLPARAASAHATFSGAPPAIEAGREVALTMDVPHERDDRTYNVEVVVAMASGWSVRSCEPKPTWTCGPATVDGRAVLRFVKDAGAAPAEDETFRFALLAPAAAGTYAFATLQTYDTGEVVRWIGAAGSASPAPQLEVTGTAPATTVAPAPPSSPSTTATPATPPAGATPTAPAPTASVVVTTAPTPATTSTAVASPAATVAAGATPTIAPTTTGTGASGDLAGDDGGGGGAAVAVIAALVASSAIAVGALVWRRSARRGA